MGIRYRCCILLLLPLLVLVASARNMPTHDATFEDQKNFLGYGFSGVGNNGLPFGGLGTGFDGGNLGGPSGLAGLGGFGGPAAGLGGFGGPGTGSVPGLPLP